MNVSGINKSFSIKGTMKSLNALKIKAKNIVKEQIVSQISQLQSSGCFSMAGNISKGQPFDEFNLSDENIDMMREELKQTGLCRIKVSEQTKKYLKKIMSTEKFISYYYDNEGKIVSENRINEDILSNKNPLFKNIYLDNKEFLNKITSFSKKILQQEDLIIDNAIIRNWGKGKGSCYWHQDANAIHSTLLLTLKGEETEYVSPDVSHKFELNDEDEKFYPLEDVENDIRKMDKDYFHLFLTPAYKNKDFPALIHRSPRNVDGRTILGINFK